MRKTIYAILVLITLALFLATTSAISTTIKESYSPGETIITQISGSILSSITSSNVELEKKGHISVPIDFEVKKLGDNFYLWFIAPKLADNYTLTIKDITTSVSGEVQEIDYKKNFSISGNLTDYSVKPGFVSTNKSFQIKVQLNEDYNKQIDLKFVEKTNFTLKPGENTLTFSVSEINESGLFNLIVGKYNLPVYVQVAKKIFVNIGGNETEIIDLTNITSTKNLTSKQEEIINQERLKYHCSEFPGKICGADETCSGESIVSLDGPCCVYGECVPKKKESGSSAWIGYLIAAIIVIVGVFIWIRYKKVKAEKNPIKKALLNEKRAL